MLATDYIRTAILIDIVQTHKIHHDHKPTNIYINKEKESSACFDEFDDKNTLTIHPHI